MRKHNGMRPQDIAVLLKIISKNSAEWFMKDISSELEISSGEISESINRSVYAGLMSSDKKTVKKLSLLDFLKCGIKYVFPVYPGAIVRGMPTSHSALPLKKVISSKENYVWPFAEGDVLGQAIEPLYPKIPFACLKDSLFYQLISLTDAIRTGNARENKLAFDYLKKIIENA